MGGHIKRSKQEEASPEHFILALVKGRRQVSEKGAFEFQILFAHSRFRYCLPIAGSFEENLNTFESLIICHPCLVWSLLPFSSGIHRKMSPPFTGFTHPKVTGSHG